MIAASYRADSGESGEERGLEYMMTRAGLSGDTISFYKDIVNIITHMRSRGGRYNGTKRGRPNRTSHQNIDGTHAPGHYIKNSLLFQDIIERALSLFTAYQINIASCNNYIHSSYIIISLGLLNEETQSILN